MRDAHASDHGRTSEDHGRVAGAVEQRDPEPDSSATLDESLAALSLPADLGLGQAASRQ